MNSLDKYILRQCATPLAFILLVATLLAWTTQSLQRVEILIDYGQGLGVFTYLSLLIIPSLLSLIIPFALFGAAAYALYRLHSDSEIAVMYAAGVSRWRIAAPILFVTLLGALATLYVNLDLMPRSYRVLRQNVAELRADLASAVVRGGEFTPIAEGLTIYVDEARAGGQFTGLLINDTRDEDNPKTYMAERAVLQETNEGPVLHLRRGNIQSAPEGEGGVDIVRFEEVAVNVADYRRRGELVLETTERYPHELLNPDMSEPYDRMNAGKLIAEGHSRYAGPLHAFAYVFVAILAMIGGPYSRRGMALRIVFAIGAVIAIRVLAFVVQGFAASSGAYWMLYALPLAVIAGCGWLLFAPAPPGAWRRPVESAA